MIRLATLKDLDRILEIKGDAVKFMKSQNNDQWDENYPAVETFISFIEKDYMYVLTEDNQILGMMGLVPYQDEEYKTAKWSVEGKELIIHRLAIAEEAYGKGLAKKMLQYAIDLARQDRVDIIKLDTYSKNKVAQKLFLDVGFEYVGDIHFPHNTPKYHCYEMVLNKELL